MRRARRLRWDAPANGPGVRPMSRLLSVAFRSLVLFGHAVWVGGFTFYSTAVLRILDDEFGTFDTGRLVTRHVTDWLNGVGAIALALWWGLVLRERNSGPRSIARFRLALLIGSTALLLFLVVDHRVLDHHLDTRGRSGFYRAHAVYLIAATAQWGANLLLIPASLLLWQEGGRRSGSDP